MEMDMGMVITAVAVPHSRMDMDMDMDMDHGQMRLHKSRKALAAAAVVMLRVAPCKPIARNRTASRTARRIAATSRLAATIWKEKAWLFCTAKYAAMTSASAISAPISHRSIWS
jgi:hypothetical protein